MPEVSRTGGHARGTMQEGPCKMGHARGHNARGAMHGVPCKGPPCPEAYPCNHPLIFCCTARVLPQVHHQGPEGQRGGQHHQVCQAGLLWLLCPHRLPCRQVPRQLLHCESGFWGVGEVPIGLGELPIKLFSKIHCPLVRATVAAASEVKIVGSDLYQLNPSPDPQPPDQLQNHQQPQPHT